MLPQCKTMASGHASAHDIDLGIDEFNTAAAAFTNKVIMIPGCHPFITDHSPAETDFPGKPCLAKQAHGAVYRGLSHRRRYPVNAYEQFLNGQVAFSVPKRCDDGFSLWCVSAPSAPQKQDKHPFLAFR